MSSAAGTSGGNVGSGIGLPQCCCSGRGTGDCQGVWRARATLDSVPAVALVVGRNQPVEPLASVGSASCETGGIWGVSGMLAGCSDSESASGG